MQVPPPSMPREEPDKDDACGPPDDTVDIVLSWEAQTWLYQLFKSPLNVAPTFRLPDLLGACVSLVIQAPQGCEDLYTCMGTELALRDPHERRRVEKIWRPQYQLLVDAQRSPRNQHPNPNFQLDQFATGCVFLARRRGEDGADVLQQARLNMAERVASVSARKRVG